MLIFSGRPTRAILIIGMCLYSQADSAKLCTAKLCTYPSCMECFPKPAYPFLAWFATVRPRVNTSTFAYLILWKPYHPALFSVVHFSNMDPAPELTSTDDDDVKLVPKDGKEFTTST